MDMDLAMKFLYDIDQGIREILNPDGSTQNQAPWYDHEEHMLKLSRNFPEYTFILSGVGEDCPEDMWKKFFTNGKMRRASAHVFYFFDDNGEEVE